MSPRMPHFLLTCGGWHTPQAWAAVQERLKSVGYESTAIPLASVDADPSKYDMTEDVEAIASAARLLVDGGEDVIVVLHSYSGQPGSEAMRGLSKAERNSQGSSQGGVVRLVFIMAYLVPEGFRPAERGDYSKVLPWMAVNRETGHTTVSISDARQVFYNDMPDSEAEEWARKLKPWSIGCSFSESTYAGWRCIPTTYVLCSQDKSVFADWARPMLDAARSSEGPCAIDTVEEGDVGHCPMISQPDWTAEMLKRAAAAAVAPRE